MLDSALENYSPLDLINNVLLESNKLFSDPAFFLLLIAVLPRQADDALFIDCQFTLSFLNKVGRLAIGLTTFRYLSKGLLALATEILALLISGLNSLFKFPYFLRLFLLRRFCPFAGCMQSPPL